MKSELQADFCDQIVETLLAVERRARHREDGVPGVLNAQGGSAADVLDGGARDRAEAGSMGPLGTPPIEVGIGWCLPRIHPNREYRPKSLVGGQFSLALAQTRVGYVEGGIGDGGCVLHHTEGVSKETEHAVWECLGLAGGPAIHASCALVGATPYEINQCLVRQQED